MTDRLIELMETLGAPGAAPAIALENLFPPLPGEVIPPLAGSTSAKGEMNPPGVPAWTTAGPVAGAPAPYRTGALLGRERTPAVVVFVGTRLAERHKGRHALRG